MRVILLLFPCFYSFCGQSQIQFDIEGGYSRGTWTSINAITSSNFPDSYTTSGLSGFQTGLVAEINLSTKFLLRPAIFVAGKGTRLNRQSWFDTSSRDIRIQYIDLPVTIVYRVRISKMAGFAGGGFYVAQAFNGIEKGKSKTLTGESFIYNKVEFGAHNDGPTFQLLPTIVKRFDYGFTILAGAELKSVQLLLTYSRGLKPLLPNEKPYNGNYTNSGLTISAAYPIKRKL